MTSVVNCGNAFNGFILVSTVISHAFVPHGIHVDCLCSVTLDFIYNYFHFVYVVEDYFQGEEMLGA